MWRITIDYADGRERKETTSPVHSAPVAVESVLREAGMGDEFHGSFQITVTDLHSFERGRIPHA